MTRTVEDSLRTVHHTQREAGLALGLSRWETICHVVIPEAFAWYCDWNSTFLWTYFW